MSRSALNTAGNIAYAAKSIYKMIKAFLRGGWYAAALEALKQYWPQLICVSLAVSLVPVIFFFSLPMFLFGFNDSSDPEMTVFNEKAAAAVRCFDNYTEYYAGFDGITGNDSNTDISVTALSADVNGGSYIGAEPGNSIIQKNRFIAIYAVSVQNANAEAQRLQVVPAVVLGVGAVSHEQVAAVGDVSVGQSAIRGWLKEGKD